MSNNKTYDESKLTVFLEKEVPVTSHMNAVARVYSYDGGAKRVKVLSRVTKPDGSQRTLKQFPPLTNVEQVEQLTKFLAECREHLTQE